MSNSATLGEGRIESLFQKMARESAERAPPAEEREAIFERLREFEEKEKEASDPGEGVPKLGETPAEAPVADEPAEPFTPAAVTYDDVPLIVIPLAYPFTIQGQAVRLISLRPPRTDYVRAVAAGEITRLDMIAEMASVSTDVLSAMRWPDADRVLGIASDLAPNMAKG